MCVSNEKLLFYVRNTYVKSTCIFKRAGVTHRSPLTEYERPDSEDSWSQTFLLQHNLNFLTLKTWTLISFHQKVIWDAQDAVYMFILLKQTRVNTVINFVTDAQAQRV